LVYPPRNTLSVFKKVFGCAACGFCAWILSAAAAWALPPAESSAASVEDTRWEDSIAAFVAADHVKAPPPGGVVFIGSSSIRLWDDVESQFNAPPVIIKRGFGGATMSACARYLDRIVVPYKPRLILVYAGDNDLAEGREPREVLNHFVRFVETVHKTLPATRIAYISIKPSPARAALIPKMREANQLIREFIAASDHLDFIDVFTSMLDATGQPRAELFKTDALHLNSAGYKLWKTIIAPYVH
jgi:lysophospholipase L1-like esterase